MEGKLFPFDEIRRISPDKMKRLIDGETVDGHTLSDNVFYLVQKQRGDEGGSSPNFVGYSSNIMNDWKSLKVGSTIQESMTSHDEPVQVGDIVFAKCNWSYGVSGTFILKVTYRQNETDGMPIPSTNYQVLAIL